MSSQARSSHKKGKAAAGSGNMAAPKLSAASSSSLAVPACSPSRASSTSPAPPREAFLPDAELAHHWIFRILMLIANWWARPLNGIEVKGLKRHVATASVSASPRGILFFGRHSTHNAEILTLCVRFWQESGRVSRALFHRLLMKGFPWLKYMSVPHAQLARVVECVYLFALCLSLTFFVCVRCQRRRGWSPRERRCASVSRLLVRRHPRRSRRSHDRS